MTQFVVLAPAIKTVDLDEIALFSKTISDQDFASLYGASTVDIFSDPQDDLGWEEVYGPDYPLTAGDIPVLQNGVCRIRYEPLYFAYAYDVFVEGIGFVELGRITVWVDDTSGAAGGVVQHGYLQSADVVEWTPERGVLLVTTTLELSSTPYRMETYISLQRGWSGPRFECYPSARGSTKLGAHIRFTPFGTASVAHVAPGGTAVFSDETWAGNGGSFAGQEPWTALTGPERTVGMAVIREGVVMRRYSDTTAYGGSARPALAIAADQSVAAVAGYVSARFGASPRGMMVQAETYRNTGSGTTSQVSDGSASGGLAVADTQSSAAAPTVTLPAGTLDASVPPGKYAVYARVLGVGGDQQVSVTATFTGDTTATNTGARTTYTWVRLGEITRDALADTFQVTAWRAGTSTSVRVDRVVIVPLERRLAGSGDLDGVRDLGFENLYDARVVPEFVAR